MKKSEFLDKLCEGLRFQPDPDEIRKVVAFYDQAIEDRMEDGMSEEDAVAALGDIDDIVREVRESWSQADAGAKSGDDGLRRDFDPAVSTRFEVYDTSGSVRLLPSPDGLVHLEYAANDRWHYEVTGENVVTIRRGRNAYEPENVNVDLFGIKFSFKKPDLGGLFSEDICLRLLVPGACPVAVSVNTASGDVKAEGIKLSSLSLRLVSGDIELDDVEVAGKLSAVTASGDVEIASVRASEISLNTTSGDVEASGLRCGGLTARSASGDVEIDGGAEILNKLSVVTVSGDIDAAPALPCPAIDCESVSGDVHLELPGSEGLYTVITRTNSGDVSIGGNALSGPNSVRVKTLSGDIDVSFGG